MATAEVELVFASRHQRLGYDVPSGDPMKLLLEIPALMFLFLSLYLVHLGFDEVSNPRLRSQV